MAFSKKTWKDRLVEFPGRRLLTRISGSADGQMVVDVTRNEGTVSQGGDAFSAANMNDLEQRIGDEFDTLKGFQPILDSTGKITGYKTSVGADTVFPFSSLADKVTILSCAGAAYSYAGAPTLKGFIPKGYKKVFVDISNYGTVHNEQGVNTCVVGGQTLGYGTHTIDDSFTELEDGGYEVTYTPTYCNQGGGMLTLKIDAML